MDQPIFTLFNKDISAAHLGIAGGVFILLAAIKYYAAGGVCRITRDLSGKTAVITGGNTGIGRQTALDLARKNCNIIIGARDKGKLEETLKQIIALNPKIKANYSVLDLGDKDSIQLFSQFVQANCQKIDFLINNAGVMMVPERRQTKNGFQMQIGINHFGHFYLTYLLFPLLKKADYFRITNVSSKAHKRTKGINFDDLQNKIRYNDLSVYAQSKLANIYFTRLLQQKIEQSKLNGITTCLHPGVVRTQLTRYIPLFLKMLITPLYPLFYLCTKSSKQGAQTSLYTVLQDKEKLVGGEYYADCKVQFSTQISKDMQCAQKLWKASEQAWGIKFELQQASQSQGGLFD